MIAFSLLLACGAEQPATPPPSRVDAVMAVPTKKPIDPAEFCENDLKVAPQTFAWPDLDGPAPEIAGGWTWVNVWATWCAPCVEEMPRLQAWEPKLQAAAGAGSLQFLSVDQTAEVVTRFLEHHPDLRAGPRIRDFSQLEGWLPTIGLDAGAVLPIHVFLDAQQRIRCVREGAVSKQDYEVVVKVLSDL